MGIDIKLIESTLNDMYKTVENRLNGEEHPELTSREAITMLGTISAFVITLCDKAKEEGLEQAELKAIWELKKESDTLLQKLFEEME